jgi:hypothetical protein
MRTEYLKRLLHNAAVVGTVSGCLGPDPDLAPQIRPGIPPLLPICNNCRFKSVLGIRTFLPDREILTGSGSRIRPPPP